MDLECPQCFRMLAVIDLPNYQNPFNRISEADRKAVLREINFQERFRRMSLKEPAQLPEIEGCVLCFTFRSATVKGEDVNIIEHQGLEVWREPLVWEGYERFMEVGRILKLKYGKRMVDLIPDPTAETFLFGDKLQAPALVAEFRKQLKGR